MSGHEYGETGQMGQYGPGQGQGPGAVPSGCQGGGEADRGGAAGAGVPPQGQGQMQGRGSIGVAGTPFAAASGQPGMAPPGGYPAGAGFPGGPVGPQQVPPGMQAQPEAYYHAPPHPAGYYAYPYVGPPQFQPAYAPMPPHYGPAGYAAMGPGMQPPQAGLAGASGGHAGRGQAGITALMEEISNGGNGLHSLGKMLNLDDTEFWKGALVGAAAVLLLTNESVQNALFKTGAKATAAVKSGAEKIKETAASATKE